MRPCRHSVVVAVLGVMTACSRPTSTPPPAMPRGVTGTFHLLRPNEVDAVNLEVSERGWRWTLCGCDSSRVVTGTVTVKDGGVWLVPSAGQAAFLWLGVSKGWMPPEVRAVELTSSADGSLVASGQDGDAGFQQRLEPGRICAVCNPDDFPGFVSPFDGGVLLFGPHGLRACAAPVPADPCDVK